MNKLGDAVLISGQ